jgi:DNA-binding SARP family transcriptional activator/tetratricopeptide (TPR) repeat protein
MIYLHTLGDALITVGEKEIRPTSPLVFAALLYLAMERGRRVPRTALQELLFPKQDERSGAHSLRQLLYKLRQLGAPVDADASSVSVKPDDVRLDSASERVLANGHLSSGSLAFLPEYSPKLSEGFGEWLEGCRAAVTAHSRRQLLTSMAKSRDSVNWAAVERFAHAILDIDPFNEEATLALAEAVALTGAKTEAIGMLEHYEQETGRGDLRLAPSILRKRISLLNPEPSRRSMRTPFVGREDDAEALRHQIQLALKGESSLMVLVGEAGIGKTRLLEEVAGVAHLEGMLVLTVRCQSHYASRPMGVFIELVPTLLSARGALGVSPQSLAYLNLLTSHDDNRGDRPTDARDDISRSSVLLTALRDLVDAVASETPLLIAVEDAHWADVDSLRELNGLVQGAPRRSLIVVYTTRVLESLRKMATIDEESVVRRLKALDEGSMRLLAHRLLPDNGGENGALASWCVQTAAGNPFFLQMLCAHYAATGQPFTVPPDMISATTRRLERLPQECRRILEFSALLGRHATVEALKSLAECTQLQLLNAVQRLEDEGHLQIKDGSARISHDLLSECALSLVPPIARRVLHSCVAVNLEQRYDSTGDASILWDCAEQWVLSGETGKAIEFLKRCARHASQIGKAAQALSLLDRAKQLAKYPGDLSDVLGEMMVMGRAAGQWKDVRVLADEIEKVPAEAVRREQHSHLELIAVEARWSTSLNRESISPLTRCVKDAAASVRHRIDAALLLVRMAHELGEVDLARGAFTAIESLLGADSLEYADRLLPLIYHTSFGDRSEALRLARHLRSDLNRFESVGDQIRAANNVAMALWLMGATGECIALCQEYYDRTGQLGLIGQQAVLCSVATAMYANEESFDAALEWHRRVELDPESPLSSLVLRNHFMNDIEFALWTRDTMRVQARVNQLAKTGIGETVRGKGFLLGAEVRLQQLDAQFDCDDSTIQELFVLYNANKCLLSADGVTVALGEALRRRGRIGELRALLEEYLNDARRELSPVPPSLQKLWTVVAGSSRAVS